jgi:hypothetical protein
LEHKQLKLPRPGKPKAAVQPPPEQKKDGAAGVAPAAAKA